ncbi:MAG: extracellular solute-binding protein [Candidatus Kapaibacterium sp.]
MKTGAILRLTSFLCTVFTFTILTGCGGEGGGSDVSTKVEQYAIETEDKFNVAPGADPSVSAEDGGAGFEDIAEEGGWKSSTLTDEQMKLIADPSATKGGEFKFAVSDFPATFRAYGKDENSQVTRMIHGFVFEPLITVNPITLDFLPVLASHWKVGEDGQTYWFRIDPNARFSDGHPVTTEDVLATYKLTTDSTILSPYTNTFYGGFDPPEAVSKYIFKVRSKDNGWKNMLYFGGTSILPAHVIGNLSGSEYLEKYQYDMPPGSGPYIVRSEDIIKGKVVSLTRRKNYWAADYPENRGVNNFDKISLLVVADERLQLEKFKKGEFDLYLIARAQWYEEEFNDEPVNRGLIQVRRIYNDEPQGVSGLAFNMRKPPFDNPKVREAFAYLFNREGLVKNLMYNQYSMTNSYYPGSVYENPNNPKITYNPEKGTALLAEAGYTNRNKEGILVNAEGKALVIEMPITDNWVRVMTPVQQEWKKAGIKLEFRQVDGPTQFKLLNERNFEMAFMSWGGLLYPNPKSSFHSELADVPNTNNMGGFKNARADELIEKELVTFDQNERVKIIRELDSILVASQQYALAWYAPFTRVAYWNKFGHPDFYLGKISDWTNIISTWWISPEKAEKLSEALKDPSIDLGKGERDIKFWPEYNEKLKTSTPVAGN